LNESDTKLVVYKPSLIAYTIKELIEKELIRLEREGNVEKVENSECSVPVPKG